VLLAGDYNVVPTDDAADIYNTRSWLKDALLQPESRDVFRRLLDQGWTDAVARLHPGKPMYTFWDYFRQTLAPMRDRQDGAGIGHAFSVGHRRLKIAEGQPALRRTPLNSLARGL